MKTNLPSRPQLDRHAFFALLVVVLSAFLIWMPDLYVSPYAQTVERARAQVLETDNSTLRQFGLVREGTQRLQVKLLDGPFAGQSITAVNNVVGKMEIDKVYSAGDVAMVVVNTSGGQVVSATAYDFFRLDTEVLLFMLFAALLIGFAGWTGAKALLSFIFTALVIWRVFIPGILLGYDPIVLGLLIASAVTVVVNLLVAGLSRTALVASLGCFLGLLFTCGTSLVFFGPFHVHGAVLPFTETLLYSGFPTLDLTRIFLAAIFIGSSGALMDLAMDISSAIHEVVEKKPQVTVLEAIGSGFAVGRMVTGTMVTTLLLAYTGGYMAMLMLFMGQGIQAGDMLNTNFVAAEILKTVIGSFGLVAVAPVTAVLGGLVFVGARR